MNKKNVLLFAIPIILITSLLDTWIIGRMTWKDYIFQCAWEYSIFWMGYWLGEKYTLGRKNNAT